TATSRSPPTSSTASETRRQTPRLPVFRGRGTSAQINRERRVCPRVSALAHVGEGDHFTGGRRHHGRRHFRLRPVDCRLRARARSLAALEHHPRQLLVHPPLRADPLHDLLPHVAALIEADAVHLLR